MILFLASFFYRRAPVPLNIFAVDVSVINTDVEFISTFIWNVVSNKSAIEPWSHIYSLSH